MSQSTERIVNQRNSLSNADSNVFISKENARVNAWEKGISYAENAVTNALNGGTKLFTALKKQSEENTQNNVDKYRTTVVDGYLETTLADSKDKFSRGELSWNPDDADSDVMNYYYNTCKNGILEDAEKRGLSKAEKAVLAKNLDSWIHSKSNSLIDFCITNGREQAIEAVGDKAQDNTSLIRQGDIRDIDNSLFLNMIDSHGYSKEGIHYYIDEAEDVSAYKAYETAFSTKNTTEENIEAIKKENNSVYESAVAELNLAGVEVTPDSILVAIKNKHDIEESKANYYMAKTSRWLAEYSIDGDKERADAVVDMLDGNTSGSFKFEIAMANIPANTPFLVQVADNSKGESAMRDIKIENKLIKYAEEAIATDKSGDYKFVATYDSFKGLESNQLRLQHTRPGVQEKFVKGAADSFIRETEAWLEIPEGVEFANVRILIQEPDGTMTDINAVAEEGAEVAAEGWYTINGVKLEGEPTVSGTYIYNGKKVFIQK